MSVHSVLTDTLKGPGALTVPDHKAFRLGARNTAPSKTVSCPLRSLETRHRLGLLVDKVLSGVPFQNGEAPAMLHICSGTSLSCEPASAEFPTVLQRLRLSAQTHRALHGLGRVTALTHPQHPALAANATSPSGPAFSFHVSDKRFALAVIVPAPSGIRLCVVFRAGPCERLV